jgi:DNA-binding NarL/FixJ family response regulator
VGRRFEFGWGGNLTTRNGESVRILVADDHETVRKGICAILSSRINLGQVGEASNGWEAIAKARELEPDVIVLDITMPELGGFEAAKEIRKLYPEMPILFLSMHDGKQIIERAKSIPVQGYVMKNQVGQSLVDAVGELLKGNTFFSDSE